MTISTEPLKKYMEAQDLLSKGKRADAANALSSAISSDSKNKFVENNLERMMEPGTVENEIALTLVAARSKT